MDFKELLLRAKADDTEAKETIFSLFRALIAKNSINDMGYFDDDMFQDLSELLLICIEQFSIERTRQ